MLALHNRRGQHTTELRNDSTGGSLVKKSLFIFRIVRVEFGPGLLQLFLSIALVLFKLLLVLHLVGAELLSNLSKLCLCVASLLIQILLVLYVL